jgi:diaminopimelate decarboxylase
MSHFHYQDDEFFVEQLPVAALADKYGTPSYIYSRASLEDNFRQFDQAFVNRKHLICYSVKANSNIAILNILARLGAGFDIVSVGELERVLKAGGDPRKIVFSGVGKLAPEIRRALETGIRCFNVESISELSLLNTIAGQVGVVAPVSLRVNPDVDARTHEYIATGLRENKFGIPAEMVMETYLRAASLPHIQVTGVDCHIGSQLIELEPFQEALQTCLMLVDDLKHQGIPIEHIDLGGGLGVRYKGEQPPHVEEYAAMVGQMLGTREMELIFEPGRSIVASAGILLTRVCYLKNNTDKHFAIVDAAMNDLVRPSLYNAWQNIIPVRKNPGEAQIYDVVGPVCESGDFLGKNRDLSISEGDLLVVETCGAYGFVMSSNYNSRNRVPEILVDGSESYEIRKRETIEQQMQLESLVPV